MDGLMPNTPEMQKRYRQRLKKRAWKLLGRKCYFCCRRAVHMAHVVQYEGGNGRGTERRYLDVIKNPKNYRGMCVMHHLLFDALPWRDQPEKPLPF